MKKNQLEVEVCEETKKRLLKASFDFRLSLNTLSKACSVASDTLRQAGPAMEKALKMRKI